MNNSELQGLHKQIVQLYRQKLLPIIAEYFEHENVSSEKVDSENHVTLVTEADLAINDALHEGLLQILPGCTIISEESNDIAIGKFAFIIDPIDGTTSFARNLDDWGISIALVGEGQTVYSVIFYPHCRTEYYYAIKGVGAFDAADRELSPIAFFKFKPGFVCAPTSRKLGRALIDLTEGRSLAFRAYGSLVYTGYTLFRGGIDAVVFDHLNIWDVAGCIFIAEQAGFVVKWFGEVPKLDNSIDITKVSCTALIYKPDFDAVLLKEVVGEIENVL